MKMITDKYHFIFELRQQYPSADILKNPSKNSCLKSRNLSGEKTKTSTNISLLLLRKLDQ